MNELTHEWLTELARERESLRVTGIALEEVVAELDELQARLDQIEALHARQEFMEGSNWFVPHGGNPVARCAADGLFYPCPTVKAARGETA